MKDEMRITVIATGFGRAESKEGHVSEGAALSPEREKIVVNFARKEENREIPTFLRSEKPREVQERIAKAARGRVSSNLGRMNTTSPPSCGSKRTDFSPQRSPRRRDQIENRRRSNMRMQSPGFNGKFL